MEDALGRVQNVALLGGSSEIGVAIAELLVTRGASKVILAGRDPSRFGAVADKLQMAGADEVATIAFDALDPGSYGRLIEDLFSKGDLDVIILAFGVLGDQEELLGDPSKTAELIQTNFTATASIGIPIAHRLRAQAHGTLVVLSSVAAERARRSNFVYGSSKAGLDAFFSGLSYELEGSGARVLVVRPGFVRTKMTSGRKEPPLSTTPEEVAKVVVSGIAQSKHVVWAPPLLRWVMTVLRHLPRAIFKRLEL